MRFLRVVIAALVAVSCGGSGKNPVAPQPVNRPPTIVRIDLVGYNVAGYGTSLPLRVEVSDPDGDPVTCRYAPDAGRVVIDGATSGCVGTYVAPSSGLSDRVGVTATDSKGAATNSSATLALGPDSIQVATAPPASNPTPAPPNPQPPNPNPTPNPNPNPTPTATPTPAPGANRAPTVTATSATPGCHPRPSAPCSVATQAVASDPDGDPITFSWQGCATGTAATSTCAISSLGAKSATVTVTDSKGASATASVNVIGMNAQPVVTVTGGGSCHPTCSLTFTGSATDPDGDPLTLSWTGCASGANPSATCSVNSNGPISATLSANDGWVVASATAGGTGSNQPPTVSCASASGSGGNNSGTVSLQGCIVDGALNEGVVLTISRSDPEGDPLTTNWTSAGASCANPGPTQVHCAVAVGVDYATVTATVTDSLGAARAVEWRLNR
jgi:Bacterial Ig domain